MSERVRASIGVTKNLGNFESMRFDYSLEVDIRDDETHGEALQRAHAEVYTFLEKKIAEEEF
jgi:hypothetical protein